MSFSFILIDLGNKIDINDFTSFISSKYINSEILYCSSKPVPENSNVKNYLFEESANVEAVLNTVTKNCQNDCIVAIRKLTSKEELLKLTSELKNNNQVVCLKNKSNKFQDAISSFYGKLLKLIFYRDYKNINHSMICFGTTASRVLKNIDAPSNLMRLNNWEGIFVSTVETSQKYRPSYNLLRCMLLTLLPLVLAITLITIFVVFKNHWRLLFKIVVWLGVLLLMALSLIFGINWIYKSKMGENINKIYNLKESNNEKN